MVAPDPPPGVTPPPNLRRAVERLADVKRRRAELNQKYPFGLAERQRANALTLEQEYLGTWIHADGLRLAAERKRDGTGEKVDALHHAMVKFMASILDDAANGYAPGPSVRAQLHDIESSLPPAMLAEVSRVREWRSAVAGTPWPDGEPRIESTSYVVAIGDDMFDVTIDEGDEPECIDHADDAPVTAAHPHAEAIGRFLERAKRYDASTRAIERMHASARARKRVRDR